MSASVTVGFAPATTPLIATGASTAPGAEGGEAGLFATLLALLGTELPAGDAGATAGIVAPLALPEGQAATPLRDLDPAVLPEVAAAAGTAQGKSLLKDLGAALLAINEALEAGKPVDPALEKKLGESLDAVAAWLSGLQPPAAPVVAPGTGETGGVDAAAPDAAPTLPVAPGSTDAAATADLPEASAAPDAPSPAAGPAAATATETPETGAVAGTPPAMVEAKPVPPVLAELGKLIKTLGAELERQLPELARQLSALGNRLETGDVPDDILAKLGISRTGETTNPELEQLVTALAAPASTPRPAAAPQPFALPALPLPDAVAPVADDDTAGPPAPAPVSASTSATGRSNDAAELGTVPVARPVEARPADATPQPASQATAPAASVVASDAATTAAAPDPGAATTQIGVTVAATGTRAIHAAYLAPVQQLNVPQVAFEVVRQFEAGNSRFQIRLDPPELGRIDVRLDLDKSGTINARMVVERPETLDLMQRDHRALQQALQQAGLDGSKTNLEFSLRQNPFAHHGDTGSDGRGQQPGFAAEGPDGGGSAEAASVSTLYRGTASAGGVNLFV